MNAQTSRNMVHAGRILVIASVVIALFSLRSESDSGAKASSPARQEPKPVPLLAKAKQEIPGLIDQLYRELDKGNPQAIRPIVSTQVAQNLQRLDYICKPFTYRAHLIENLAERQNSQVHVRVRALFKPCEEKAYVLKFQLHEGRFYLIGAENPPTDWFATDIDQAVTVARKFIYALKANERTTARQSVSDRLDISPLVSGKLHEILMETGDVKGARAEMESVKGLKAKVTCRSEGFWNQISWTFFVEEIDGQYKIVKWRCNPMGMEFGRDKTVEDPDLVRRTLQRFGLNERA